MEKSQTIKSYFFTNIKNKIQYFFYRDNDYGYIGIVLLRLFIPLILIVRLFLIKGQFKFLFFENGYLNRDVKFLLGEKSIDLYYIHLNSVFHTMVSYDIFIKLFFIIYTCLCISVFFGFLTRFSSLLLLILNFIFLNSCTKFIYGVDYITQVFLFYIFLIPSGKKFSIDNLYINKINLFKWDNAFSNPLPFYRALQLQLCLIYFFGGIGKSIGYNWWNGHSIWKALNFGSYFTGLDYSYICKFPYLLVFLGIFTVLLETFYPMLIFFNRTKKITIYLVILMHLFIGIFIGLYYFSSVMIILNIVSFPKLFFNEEFRKHF
jgi:hypothetical protein